MHIIYVEYCYFVWHCLLSELVFSSIYPLLSSIFLPLPSCLSILPSLLFFLLYLPPSILPSLPLLFTSPLLLSSSFHLFSSFIIFSSTPLTSLLFSSFLFFSVADSQGLLGDNISSQVPKSAPHSKYSTLLNRQFRQFIIIYCLFPPQDEKIMSTACPCV